MSAAEFIADRPHIVTWTLECGRTGTACIPGDKWVTDFSRVRGFMRSDGVFHATELQGIYIEGYRIRSLMISPDWELWNANPEWLKQVRRVDGRRIKKQIIGQTATG